MADVRAGRFVLAVSLVVASTAVASPALARDQMWVVKDEDGNLVFTNIEEPGAIPVNLRDPPAINPSLDYMTQERKFDGLIVKYSEKYRVEPFLVKAIIRAESMFDPDAMSGAGAEGLMQLMPETGERFGVKDLTDPEQNIKGGTAYIRWLLDYFKGDSKLAIAAYNCGETLVKKEGRVPNIPETEGYVLKVETARMEYKLKGLSASAGPVYLQDVLR